MTPILKVLRLALMVILSILVVFVSIQVVYRQLGITGSFGWTEEASRGLFVWMVMMGAALGVAEKSHFAIGSLAKKLPGKLGAAARYLKFACMAAVALIFVVEGWAFAVKGLSRVSLVTGLPLAWTFAALFVAGVLMCLFLILQLFGKDLPEANKPELDI